MCFWTLLFALRWTGLASVWIQERTLSYVETPAPLPSGSGGNWSSLALFYTLSESGQDYLADPMWASRLCEHKRVCYDPRISHTTQWLATRLYILMSFLPESLELPSNRTFPRPSYLTIWWLIGLRWWRLVSTLIAVIGLVEYLYQSQNRITFFCLRWGKEEVVYEWKFMLQVV